MENLTRPKSIQIPSDTKLSNIKLSNYNPIIKKKYKISTLSQSIRNSPFNLFQKKNNQNRNTSSLNITDNKIKTTKSNFFKSSKKYIIKAIDSSIKEKDTSKLDFKSTPNSNQKSPINLKKNDKIIIKYIKNYPKTFYQKISNSIQKMKIQTDKTLKAMRKNLKISNREIFHRTTSVINIHKINNMKKKKNKKKLEDNYDFNNNDQYSNLDYSKIYKNSKRALIQISPFSERINYKKSKTNSNNSFNGNMYLYKNIKLLGLSKIPNTSFHNIKNKPFYIPLFKRFEINRNFYKNMYHFRSFEMNNKILQRNTNKIYGNTNAIVGLSSYEKEPEIQLKFILNKIKLILDNIKHFKSNYMIKRDFRLAFINMENPVKAEYNYILEELCALLINIIPQLLKGFYNSLDQLLFITIPGIDDEMQKKPANEIECLKFNINFFNKVSDYFSACVDIFNVIQKQIAEFKYTSNEFQPLNKNLDLARYDSTRLISMADSYIEKTKNDEDIFSKFEIGLNLKKKKIKESEEIDDFERFHKRRRIKVNGEFIKIDRINSALNIASNGMVKDISDENRKRIKNNKNNSILNSSLIKDMMKYFENNIKAQIISQQVIERFKTKELKRLRNIEDKASSINDVN